MYKEMHIEAKNPNYNIHSKGLNWQKVTGREILVSW